MSDTEKLVKKIVACCLSGYHHDLSPIEYTQESPEQPTIIMELDNMIDNAVATINDLETTYYQIINNEDFDEEEIYENVEHKLMRLFPTFDCMHSDSIAIFVKLIIETMAQT